MTTRSRITDHGSRITDQELVMKTLIKTALSNLSNLQLTRRAWRVDRRAGGVLLPYLGWTAFLTALNAAIVRRNR
jgi:tryptophan-rich sensory protein